MKKKDMYKIGSKVRHKRQDKEGRIAISPFGVSVNGYYYENDNLVRFHTLSMTQEELKANWKRVYKFKYIEDWR